MIYIFIVLGRLIGLGSQLGAGIYLWIVSDASFSRSPDGFEMHIKKHDVARYDEALAKTDAGLCGLFKAMGFLT